MLEIPDKYKYFVTFKILHVLRYLCNNNCYYTPTQYKLLKGTRNLCPVFRAIATNLGDNVDLSLKIRSY